jgi:hypothetical protein
MLMLLWTHRQQPSGAQRHWWSSWCMGDPWMWSGSRPLPEWAPSSQLGSLARSARPSQRSAAQPSAAQRARRPAVCCTNMPPGVRHTVMLSCVHACGQPNMHACMHAACMPSCRHAHMHATMQHAIVMSHHQYSPSSADAGLGPCRVPLPWPTCYLARRRHRVACLSHFTWRTTPAR